MRIERLPDGTARTALDDSAWQSRTPDFKLWDNWSWIPQGGRTVINGVQRIGGDEVGEVCYGVSGGAGRIADIGFSIFNLSSTGTLTRFRETFRIYTLDGTLVHTISDLVGTFDAPGTGETVYFGAGALTGFEGSVPQNFMLTLQYSEVVGIDISDIGVQYGSPISFGTSPSYSLNRTTGQQLQLPGGDHFLLMLHTDAVPAPGVLATLLAASPCVLRRRR